MEKKIKNEKKKQYSLSVILTFAAIARPLHDMVKKD